MQKKEIKKKEGSVNPFNEREGFRQSFTEEIQYIGSKTMTAISSWTRRKGFPSKGNRKMGMWKLEKI